MYFPKFMNLTNVMNFTNFMNVSSVFNKIKSFNIFDVETPYSLYAALLLINISTPTYMEKKGYEVIVFRYIFYLSPALFILSWMYLAKSVTLGVLAAIVWKTNTANNFPLRGSPSKCGLLWVIIELAILFLNLSICVMLTNCDLLTNPYVLYGVLLARCYFCPACLLLFREPNYYLQRWELIIPTTSYRRLHIKETFTYGIIGIFTAVEYWCIVKQKELEANFNDADITNMTICEFANIMGRLMTGIMKKDIARGKFPLRYAHLIQVLGAVLIMQVARRNIANCVDNRQETFAEVETLVPMILIGFGDACFAKRFGSLCTAFIDRSSEALVLVKYGQMLIFSFATAYTTIGFSMATSVFLYLCSINIAREEP